MSIDSRDPHRKLRPLTPRAVLGKMRPPSGSSRSDFGGKDTLGGRGRIAPPQPHLDVTSPHRQRYHLPPRSSIPHPLHSDTDSSTTDHRPATYAQVVTRYTTGDAKSDVDGWTIVRSTQNTRRPPSSRRPVDPRQEGRCYCCLARGHVARSCREPVKCRICR